MFVPQKVARRTTLLMIVFMLAAVIAIPALGQGAGGDSSGFSGIEGQVTAQYTSRSIAQALVTLKETGEKTSTDRTGTFRFTDLEPGTYTVEVSYLGYNDGTMEVQVASGEVASLSVVLDITVYDAVDVVGTRGSQITSLNKQRAADNIINVVSSDLGGKFPDATAAEALRRVPGISFQRDERGGEGEFISIRGLDAGLNNVKVNGMNSAAAQIGDRRVPLNVFQADAIAEIVVNKTLLPYHDGEGVGGAVELRTRSPLDLGDQLRVSLEGQDAGLTDETGGRVSVSYSNVFGAEEKFGIFLSGSFRQRPLRTYQFDVLGDHLPVVLPLDENGNPIEDFSDLPDDIAFSEITDSFAIEDMRVNAFDDDRENTSLAGGFEWRPTDNTLLSLNATYNVQEILNNRSTVSFNQSDDFTDRDANGNLISDDGRFFFRGRSPDLLVRGEVEDRKSTNSTLVFEGTTVVNNDWNIKYILGLARGKEELPNSTEVNFLLEDIDDLDGFVTPQGASGFPYIGFDTSGEIPIPLLTPRGYAALTNPAIMPFDSIDVFDRSIEEDRQSAGVDFDHNVGAEHLKKVRFGVKYDRLDREAIRVELFDDDDLFPDGRFGGGGSFNLSDTDLLSGDRIDFDDIDSPIPGLPGLLGFDRNAVLAFSRNLRASLNGQIDGLSLDREAEEEIASAYSMVTLDLTDRWQFLGGVRVERTETTVTPFQDIDLEFDDDDTIDPRTSDDDLRLFQKGDPETSSETHVLPRVLFNYRHSDSLIFRVGMFTALARPQFSALGTTQEIDYSEEDSELSIELGNPDLEAAYSINLDVGVEYYSDEIGILSANVFYKDIDNFLYNDQFANFSVDEIGDLQLDQIAALDGIDIAGVDDISVSRPQDGNSATVMGIELNYVQQFRSLPGAWGGLGVIANVTFQETEADVEVAEGFIRRVPFFNAPEYLGTVALTYAKYGFDVALSYSFQAEQIDSLEFYQVDEYEQPYDALDLTIDYSLPWRDRAVKLYLRANDLTNDGTRAINHETRGTTGRLLDDIEFIGRQVVLGIRGKF